MSIFWCIVGGAVVAVWVGLFCHGRGYQQGRLDADNWWIRTEESAERAQKRRWMEELRHE